MKIFVITLSDSNQQTSLMSRLSNARIQHIQTGNGLAIRTPLDASALGQLIEENSSDFKELSSEELKNAAPDLRALAEG